MPIQQMPENTNWTREIAKQKKESSEHVDQKEEDPKETEEIEEQKKQNE